MQNEETDFVEKEDLFDNDDDSPQIKDPYDPSKVDIVSQQLSIHSILDRLENGEIDLNPDFQRGTDLWKPREQSLLVESLLIRMPLPMFYFDARENDCWGIVDGLQRISTLNNFVLRKQGDPMKLRLSNLEYLKEYEGKAYEDLPRARQRQIQESQILCYCIRAGTPDDVTISIFKRINTGGLVLNQAEIRNAVYRGRAADLVKAMAESDEFKNATKGKVKPKRMEDRDLATRFLAFYIQGVDKYKGVMLDFLEKGMSAVKHTFSEKDCASLLDRFKRVMNFCEELFGANAFRKLSKETGKYGPINKSLFECVSVCAAHLSDDDKQKLLKNKDMVFSEYEELFKGRFYETINISTGNVDRVKTRHTEMSNFFKMILRKR